MIRQIPNLFTLINLVFGCLAILFVLQVDESMAYTEAGDLFLRLPEHMVYGSFCIAGAAVIDFLDGFIARWLNAASEMGKQLDSLCDAVSFGVAPSLIAYQLLKLSYLKSSGALDISIIVLTPALLIACCAVWRLAKFNIDQRQSVSFRGVPTPITAMVFASMPMILWFDAGVYSDLLLNPWLLYGLVLITSFLMVSDWPMMSFKISVGGVKQNMPQLIFLLVALIAVFVLKWVSIPVIYIVYVLLSLLFRNKILSVKS
jgi:CDP-diacylglycerol--serine O-phosphatidyltransferase